LLIDFYFSFNKLGHDLDESPSLELNKLNHHLIKYFRLAQKVKFYRLLLWCLRFVYSGLFLGWGAKKLMADGTSPSTLSSS